MILLLFQSMFYTSNDSDSYHFSSGSGSGSATLVITMDGHWPTLNYPDASSCHTFNVLGQKSFQDNQNGLVIWRLLDLFRNITYSTNTHY